MKLCTSGWLMIITYRFTDSLLFTSYSFIFSYPLSLITHPYFLNIIPHRKLILHLHHVPSNLFNYKESNNSFNLIIIKTSINFSIKVKSYLNHWFVDKNFHFDWYFSHWNSINPFRNHTLLIKFIVLLNKLQVFFLLLFSKQTLHFLQNLLQWFLFSHHFLLTFLSIILEFSALSLLFLLTFLLILSSSTSELFSHFPKVFTWVSFFSTLFQFHDELAKIEPWILSDNLIKFTFRTWEKCW